MPDIVPKTSCCIQNILVIHDSHSIQVPNVISAGTEAIQQWLFSNMHLNMHYYCETKFSTNALNFSRNYSSNTQYLVEFTSNARKERKNVESTALVDAIFSRFDRGPSKTPHRLENSSNHYCFDAILRLYFLCWI